MLTKNMMQMIQDLKLRGFAENEIADQLRKAGEKVPSMSIPAPESHCVRY